MDNNSPIVKSLLKFRKDLQLSNKLIFTPFCFTLGEFTKLFESVSPNGREKAHIISVALGRSCLVTELNLFHHDSHPKYQKINQFSNQN